MQQTINNGESGLIIRNKLNENFTELYTDKYKVYTALLTQTGGDAPVVTILENTIGDIEWSFIGVNRGTLKGAFTIGKTFILINGWAGGPVQGVNFFYDITGAPDYFDITSYMYDTPLNVNFEIRVYPA